jgi:hypothetical protein
MPASIYTLARPNSSGVDRVSRRKFISFLLGGLLLVGTDRGQSEETTSSPVVVVVYGDSQAQGLAAGLRNAIRGSQFRLVNRTKPGTALGQPATHDWVAAVRHSVMTDHPAIAVVMFGGNDRVPVRLPDGRSLAFRSDAWVAYYGDRLRQLIAALGEAGTRIVWCGNPNAREQRYAADMAYLNELYREALRCADAIFVDTNDVAANPSGAFLSHGPGPDGVVRRLRSDDGIHFTAAGYELVANRVLPAMRTLAQRPALSPAEEISSPECDPPTPGAGGR